MSRTALFAFSLSITAVALCAGVVRADDPAPRGAPAAKAAVDLQNAICPVTGKPITPGITETVNGAVVHFCCVKCAAMYRANPKPYETALRADAAVARRMDEANKGNANAPGSPAPANPPPAPAPGGPAPMSPPASPPAPGAAAPMKSAKSETLHDAMRRLWDDHVSWTRLFLVSAVADLPDKDAATNRLLRNQSDIGDAIKPYYGDDAGNKLTALLKEHITTAADLVIALKTKDSAKAEAAKTQWFANADAIAKFLSDANPTNWPADATKSMMREHLTITTDEVASRLKGDWDADIAAYERAREQALMMADMLSEGIEKQFPQRGAQ